MNIIVLAAGAGKRFSSHSVPKPYIPVKGIPMVALAARTLDIKGKYYYVLREFHDEFQQNRLMEMLQGMTPDSNIHLIPDVTAGAAVSALLVSSDINNDQELIIVNCDQIMNWCSEKALSELRKYDASVVTTKSTDPKHSFLKLDQENKIVEVVEKNPVSDVALTGIHYWKKGKYFVQSTRRMISRKHKVNNEYYVSTSFNYLLKMGLTMGYYNISPTDIHFVGTPEDLEIFQHDS